MITFDEMISDFTITSDGRYIKLVLGTSLIEYVVGTLINVDFDPIMNAKGVTLGSYITQVEIGDIVAVKLADGELYRLKEVEEI